MSRAFQKSIQAIEDSGALLVFPVKNAKEPDSIWRHLHPRSKMVWDWNEDGSHKVHDLWHLMKRLSDCREVVYSKWYQGRATFFSREVFAALLRRHNFTEDGQPQEFEVGLDDAGHSAQQILEALEMDSPLSTKELKRTTDLQGRMYEGLFNKAMQILFRRFLIVGFGEVDDGAFPSLAVGATHILYEDLWEQAAQMSIEDADKVITAAFPEGSKFKKFYERTASI